MALYTNPSISKTSADALASTLQQRLDDLIDLALTLKHIHWNVVGPSFQAVHEMLDEHVDDVQEMADDVAERIATLGGVPHGLPAGIASRRGDTDYGLGRASVTSHLVELDARYQQVIAQHRDALNHTEDTDPVTTDMLTGQIEKLELYQWFVRAHLDPTP